MASQSARNLLRIALRHVRRGTNITRFSVQKQQLDVRGFSTSGRTFTSREWRRLKPFQKQFSTSIWPVGQTLAALAITALYLAYEQPTLRCDAPAAASLGRHKVISYEEVQKHVTQDDCWVILNGFVYDMTEFLETHPGGRLAILQQAGKDASEKFALIHPSDAIGTLPPEHCIGIIDPATLPEPEEKELTEAEIRQMEAREDMPQVENMLLLQDFEHWAERVLSTTAWAYYRSAADEEASMGPWDTGTRRKFADYVAAFYESRDAWHRYFFRPRILRDMTHGNTTTTFMGIPTAMPIFIAPAAMAKLGHPLGEINLTKAAGAFNIVQAISSNASCSLEEIFDASLNGQPLVFQLYLNKDRSASEALIQKVTKLGAKAIMLTVDVCWESKRTLDVRTKELGSTQLPISPSTQPATEPSLNEGGVSQAISGYQDRNLIWSDIAFIRRNTHLPIIVKGVQSIEDVQLCVDHNVDGVIISNHGGRQADYAPAPVDILYELRILRPDLFSKIEVMIDGGVRSGADVVKALALGAKAVGIGRPILYANGTHGEAGVRRAIQILHEEITNTMRNIGANRIEDLRPEMVGPKGPWVGRNRPPYAPIYLHTARP